MHNLLHEAVMFVQRAGITIGVIVAAGLSIGAIVWIAFRTYTFIEWGE